MKFLSKMLLFCFGIFLFSGCSFSGVDSQSVNSKSGSKPIVSDTNTPAKSVANNLGWLTDVTFNKWDLWYVYRDNMAIKYYIQPDQSGALGFYNYDQFREENYYRLLNIDSSNVAIWSYAKARWVCCDWGNTDQYGSATFVANRTEVGPWETFRLFGDRREYMSNNNCKTYFNLVNNISVRPGYDPGPAGVGAVYNVFEGNHGYPTAKIALRWAYSGKYVCADLNNGSAGPLYSNRDAVDRWETFYILDCGIDPEFGDNLVALRSWATNKYLGADVTETRLQADRDTLNSMCLFYIIDLGSNYVLLQSRYNGKYFRGDSFKAEQTNIGMGCMFEVVGLSGY